MARTVGMGDRHDVKNQGRRHSHRTASQLAISSAALGKSSRTLKPNPTLAGLYLNASTRLFLTPPGPEGEQSNQDGDQGKSQ
jgi:hypothetical protein